MTENIKITKHLWYLKNRKRLLAKARENYRKQKGLESMRQTQKKIILTFD